MRGKSIRNEDVERARRAAKAEKRANKRRKAIDRKNQRRWQAQ